MKRLGFICSVIVVSIPFRNVDAALVRAVVQPIKFICSSIGDPFCAGGQVLGDPALERSIQTVTSASPQAVAHADKSYIDPRFGTANSTSGSAIARFGLLRAAATASVLSQPPLTPSSSSPNLMRLSTFSTALYEDVVTIMPTSLALVGTAGTMSATLLISGQLNLNSVNGKPSTSSFPPNMSSADWRIQISLGGTTVGSTLTFVPGFFGGKTVDVNGIESIGGLGTTGVVSLINVPFVFGTPTSLQVVFSADAEATVDAANVQPLTTGFTLSSAESLYVSTAKWNGIQSVKSGQTPVPFTLTSASGVNYANPVPLPIAAVLFASGLPLLCRRTGRSRPSNDSI